MDDLDDLRRAVGEQDEQQEFEEAVRRLLAMKG